MGHDPQRAATRDRVYGITRARKERKANTKKGEEKAKASDEGEE